MAPIPPQIIYNNNRKALQSVYPGMAKFIHQIQPTPPPAIEPSNLDTEWNDNADLHILYPFSASVLLDQLDEKISLANLRDNGNRRLLLIEDRVELFRWLLETQDIRHWILSERCLLLVHPSLQNGLQSLLKQYPEISIAMIHIYKGNSSIPDETVQTIFDMICAVNRSLKKTLEETIPKSVHARLPYPKSITFFVAGHNYIQDSCCRAVNEMGYQGSRLQWRDPLYRFIRRVAWFHAHRNEPIDTALFLNTTPLSFCHHDYFPVMNIQSIAWFVDNPKRFAIQNQLHCESCDAIGVFDKTYIPYLQTQTYCRVLEVRTGYGIDETCGSPSLDFSNIDIAFVGELGAKSTHTFESAYLQIHPEILAFSNDFFSSINLSEIISLDDLIPKSIPKSIHLPYTGNLVTYFENKAAYLRRKMYLESIANPHLRVFGDTEWENPNWAGKSASCYAGKRLDYFTELPRLYATAKINLNIFHPQCISAPNPRVYDVLACGGFLLSTYNPGLEDEFTIGEDVDVFHTTDELQDKIEYYLTHPEERRRIAQNGKQKVLAKCSYSDRMALFFSALCA